MDKATAIPEIGSGAIIVTNNCSFGQMDGERILLDQDPGCYMNTNKSLPYVCGHKQRRVAMVKIYPTGERFVFAEGKVCLTCLKCRQVALDGSMSELVLKSDCSGVFEKVMMVFGDRVVDLSREAKDLILKGILCPRLTYREVIYTLSDDKTAESE